MNVRELWATGLAPVVTFLMKQSPEYRSSASAPDSDRCRVWRDASHRGEAPPERVLSLRWDWDSGLRTASRPAPRAPPGRPLGSQPLRARPLVAAYFCNHLFDGDPAGAGAGHGPRFGLSAARVSRGKPSFAHACWQPKLVPGISLLRVVCRCCRGACASVSGVPAAAVCGGFAREVFHITQAAGWAGLQFGLL